MRRSVPGTPRAVASRELADVPLGPPMTTTFSTEYSRHCGRHPLPSVARLSRHVAPLSICGDASVHTCTINPAGAAIRRLMFLPTLPLSYPEALGASCSSTTAAQAVPDPGALDHSDRPDCSGGRDLGVTVTARADAQCLFALPSDRDRPYLLGMMIFLRTDIETLLVVYLSVAENSSRSGARPRGSVVFAFVQEIRRIARRLRGIRRVTLIYPHGGQFHIPVRVERPPVGPDRTDYAAVSCAPLDSSRISMDQVALPYAGATCSSRSAAAGSFRYARAGNVGYDQRCQPQRKALPSVIIV